MTQREIKSIRALKLELHNNSALRAEVLAHLWKLLSKHKISLPDALKKRLEKDSPTDRSARFP